MTFLTILFNHFRSTHPSEPFTALTIPLYCFRSYSSTNRGLNNPVSQHFYLLVLLNWNVKMPGNHFKWLSRCVIREQKFGRLCPVSKTGQFLNDFVQI